MGALRGWWDEFALAWQFLTRLPLPARLAPRYSAAAMQCSVRCFPLVGAVVGLAGGLIACGAAQLWSAPIAALWGVASTVWLTCALHEDGLADTADALWAPVPRDKALRIMKDPHLGSFGAVALILSLGARVLLLAEVLSHGVQATLWVMVGAHMASRALPVLMMAALPDARAACAQEPLDPKNSHGQDTATGPQTVTLSVPKTGQDLRRTTWRDAGVSALWGTAGIALAAAAHPTPAIVFPLIGGALALLWTVMRQRLRARLGGTTGDTLGALVQLGEMALVLVWLAAWRG